MKKLIKKFVILAVISTIMGYMATKDIEKQKEEYAEPPQVIEQTEIQEQDTEEDISFQTVSETVEETVEIPTEEKTVAKETPVPVVKVSMQVENKSIPSNTPAPTLTPTEVPTPTLTTEPTVEPTPTSAPTVEPTPIPTIQPTAEPTPIPTPEPTPLLTPTPEPQVTVDINHWVAFAQNYAQSIGLVLESSAVDCWDNPIPVNSKTLYVEQNIVDRLTRYKNLEGFTDVWIWYEDLGNSIYNLYIGYA